MSFSRRDFIKMSGSVAAGVVLVSGQTTFGSERQAADLLSYQNAASFRNHLGSDFFLSAEGVAVSAVLVDVKDSPVSVTKTNRRNRKTRPECFSLSFSLAEKLPQATYSISHQQMGQFDLFMVPGANENGEPLLHAVINRI